MATKTKHSDEVTKGDTIINWECECGFPYNFMDMTECDECGKPKPKDAPESKHKVIGTCNAASVTLD